MTIEIRRMRADEAEAVSALIADVIGGLGAYYTPEARQDEIARHSAEALCAAVGEDPDAVLVAAHAGAPVGFCVSNDDDGPRWLAWYGVAQAWQRRGVARKLLDTLGDISQARGHHKIWCDCRTDNLPSRDALRAAGFREVCTLCRHWYGLDFLLLEKWLESS